MEIFRNSASELLTGEERNVQKHADDISVTIINVREETDHLSSRCKSGTEMKFCKSYIKEKRIERTRDGN